MPKGANGHPQELTAWRYREKMKSDPDFIAKRRAYSRAYYEAHKNNPIFNAARSIKSKQYYKDPYFGKRIRARREVGRAIEAGKIVRLACEQCGDPKSQGHHHDYDRPLDVTWLCRKCHDKEHMRTRPKVAPPPPKISIGDYPAPELIAEVYSVSREGNVTRVHADGPWPANHKLSPFRKWSAYLFLGIRIGGRRYQIKVHHLVAMFHLPPRPSKLHQIRHLDGDCANNYADNLVWGTAKENSADRIRHEKIRRASPITSVAGEAA